MASPKQPVANRLKAQKSTGPGSAEGKARASMNALKTGIDARSHTISGEPISQLEDLTNAAKPQNGFVPQNTVEEPPPTPDSPTVPPPAPPTGKPKRDWVNLHNLVN